jgi:hypothetical protein
VLWELEQRRSWQRVAEKHTLLLATILRCLRDTPSSATGAALCRRLLQEKGGELMTQMTSGSGRGLVSATLRLLTAVARFNPGMAREVSGGPMGRRDG